MLYKGVVFGVYGFQFYLSSIKSISRKMCNRVCVMFQFYLSSIKRCFTESFIRFSRGFQFYLSSIKSECYFAYSGFHSSFQFYLSSIKRFVPVLAAFTFCCFNSTLVQLKGINYGLFIWNLTKFQFYLSSIKRKSIS